MNKATKTTCKKGADTKRTMKTRRIYDLNFLSWNVHDIRTKDEGLKSSLDEFTDVIGTNDVFCLQETKEVSSTQAEHMH